MIFSVLVLFLRIETANMLGRKFCRVPYPFKTYCQDESGSGKVEGSRECQNQTTRNNV